MSNYWNLLCRTCDEVCELGWNRGGDTIQQLIPHMAAIAAVREAVEIGSPWWPGDGFPYGLMAFAEKHKDHALIAIDEYGSLHGDCAQYFKCACCGHPLRCGKPQGHEGECGPLEGGGS